MINQLIIKGFKSFVNNSINFNQLNVLTGLNSSGKSTVIQALQILNKYSRNFKNPLIEGHGDYKELQNPFSSLPFSINARYCEDRMICYSPLTENNIYADDFPGLIVISADRYGPLVSIPLLSDCELGPKGENVIKCIEMHENDILDELVIHPCSEGDTFLYNLRAWLGTISPGVQFDYNIIDKADTSFSLFNGYRAKNVGFGLSYTLPIIVALFLGTIKKNILVILENPEAHLHPRGQTEMGKLIASVAHSGCQVIVETHSDHLFDGIRIYAKNNKGFADKVLTHWFEQDKGISNVTSIKMDNYGRIKEWPEGMFDQFEINASDLL